MKIGNCELILGDCFEVMRSWPDKTVDMVLSSPPFRNEDLGFSDDTQYYEWYDKLLLELKRVTKNYILLFNSSLREIQVCCREIKPIRILHWYKGEVSQTPYRSEPIFLYPSGTESYKMNRDIYKDVFKAPPIAVGQRIRPKHTFNESALKAKMHPYRDPLKLYEEIMRQIHKEPSNQIIFDPFAGSGTTLLAAQKYSLSGIGTEIEEWSYNEALKRLENYHGQTHLLSAEFESKA